MQGWITMLGWLSAIHSGAGDPLRFLRRAESGTQDRFGISRTHIVESAVLGAPIKVLGNSARAPWFSKNKRCQPGVSQPKTARL
ncbi:hypothetical protein QL093DRAFT_2388154 [Fusarium oxysporum]|nr:hypothetical protein QL093DRAFT_2388154 [Fusarium oxysporum]